MCWCLFLTFFFYFFNIIKLYVSLKLGLTFEFDFDSFTIIKINANYLGRSEHGGGARLFIGVGFELENHLKRD